MIVSKGVLWAILIGFFVFTAAAVVMVNRNVHWGVSEVVDFESAEVLDVW